MRELAYTAPDVHSGYLGGDFVVEESHGEESHGAFNQTPDDQGLEHVNKMGKIAGGLTSITRSDGACDRWCLTYNERAILAQDTRVMFRLNEEREEHVGIPDDVKCDLENS